jgi:predicted metal-dependent phosphoesterase TrpH
LHRIFSRGEQGGEKGIAYISLEYVDAFDAIEAIRQAGGVPVIAHPKQFDNFAAIPEWIAAGLQGVELRHPLHDEKTEQLAQQIADKFNLLKTGGSDFHGFYSETDHYPLGSKSIGMANLQALQERIS